jgi:membrane-bound lytic murein transglycosylase D
MNDMARLMILERCMAVLKSIFTYATLVLLFLTLSPKDATVATANTQSTTLFPLPDALKPNVEFWINVYARWSEREVIIHDSENLQFVYEVIHLDDLFKNVNVSTRIQWKKIGRIKNQYKTILLKLSKQNNIDISRLTGKERQVAELYKDNLDSKSLRRAAFRVRAQSGLKERFKKGLQRSGLYLSRMRTIFQKENLPLELLVLPHVESSFNYRAYSKFGAAGIWQFTRSTGRSYMTINYSVDERLDPMVATESAAKLLKTNYKALGSWPLAITAYNHGRNGMKRAKSKYGYDIGKIVRYYKSRTFGFASRNFYTEFLAALEVATNYRKYFGAIAFDSPREFIVFESPHYITVKTLLSELGIAGAEFADYNPGLRKPVLQSQRRIPKNYKIRVPFKPELDMYALYARISSDQKFEAQVSTGWHKVRFGENLSLIASRYRVSVREIMELNNIRNAHRIYEGQNLQIPASDRVMTASKPVPATSTPTQLADATTAQADAKRGILDVAAVSEEQPLQEKKTEQVNSDKLAGTEHKVESLPVQADITRQSSIVFGSALDSVKVQVAKYRYDSTAEIMDMALPDYSVQMTRSMGSRVVKAPPTETVQRRYRELEFPRNGQVTVEPDETIGHFADWLSVAARRLRTINGFSYGQAIHVGQSLWLTFEKVTPEEFHNRRLEFHQGIEEDFYRSFSVAGEKEHTVRRGESIWIICNRNYEVPYWLVKKYNPNTDLIRLAVGQKNSMPVVEARYAQKTFSGE